MADDLFSLISDRMHPTLAVRYGQISTNLLALDGGRPYIDARLSRFPAESPVQWDGSTTSAKGVIDASKWPALSSPSVGAAGEVTGRRDRAYLTNYCDRIATKLDQYVFQQLPERDGLDEDWAENVTATGWDINRYWRRVSELITSCRWCWVGADLPGARSDVSARPMSVAEKRDAGVRPYWSIYTPLDVVDWAFDERGNLLWMLTEYTEQTDADPTEERGETRYRVLWEPGNVQKFRFGKDDSADEIVAVETVPNPPAIVPFVAAGDICARPHWFDDAESIQRSILDLASARHECMFRQVYAQLVIERGSIQNAADQAGMQYEQAIAKTVGMAYPIEESPEAKGLTRYITPSAADLAIIGDTIQQTKRDLFEVVGFALRPDTKQVESAEAKLFDHLDVEAVLAERSQMLEEVETRLVDITAQIDPSWSAYTPEYSNQFDVGDFAEEIQSFLGLQQMDAPPEASREITRAALNKARARGLFRLNDSEWAALMDTIDAHDFDPPAPIALPGMEPAGDEDEDEDVAAGDQPPAE